MGIDHPASPTGEAVVANDASVRLRLALAWSSSEVGVRPSPVKDRLRKFPLDSVCPAAGTTQTHPIAPANTSMNPPAFEGSTVAQRATCARMAEVSTVQCFADPRLHPYERDNPTLPGGSRRIAP